MIKKLIDMVEEVVIPKEKPVFGTRMFVMDHMQ